MKKDKQKKAAALQYNMEKDNAPKNAPKIVASGKGDIAEKILKKAKEEEIHIEKNQDLVEVLVQMELGEEIPPELYEIVAEILSFIYSLENK